MLVDDEQEPREKELVYDARKDIDLAAEISTKTSRTQISPTAWWLSAKKWLEKNNLITILEPGKVLPHFHSNLCHE